MSYHKRLLIIAHMPSANTLTLGNALLEGATDSALENIEAELKSPFDCSAEDALNADAIILFTTENFGYMSGALKDFFERVYYPCLDQPQHNEAKPFALVIKAGMDGAGTNISVHKITTGLKWKEVHQTLICRGEFKDKFIDQCRTLALTIAAGLDNDLI